MEFSIDSRGGSAIEIIEGWPGELPVYRLPLATAITAKADFGTMVFQHFEGSDFAIWYSKYHVTHSAIVHGRADMAVLELHIAWQNHFDHEWEGVAQTRVRPMQFNLSYTPHINTRVQFLQGQEYETMDFHLSLSFFEDIRNDYELLQPFFEKVVKKEAANIEGVCTITPEMRAVIEEIKTVRCKDAVKAQVISRRVKDLVVYALEALNAKVPVKEFKMTSALKDKAYQAKQILDENIRKRLSIAKLAKKVETNVRYLQLAFQHCFGITIFEYYNEIRLKRVAYLLLNRPQCTLDEIADEAGYNDPPYLVNVFKKRYGCTPGEFRKIGRIRNG